MLYWAYSLQPLLIPLSTQIFYRSPTAHTIGFKPKSVCSYYLSLQLISALPDLKTTFPFSNRILFSTGDISARQLIFSTVPTSERDWILGATCTGNPSFRNSELRDRYISDWRGCIRTGLPLGWRASIQVICFHCGPQRLGYYSGVDLLWGKYL